MKKIETIEDVKRIDMKRFKKLFDSMKGEDVDRAFDRCIKLINEGFDDRPEYILKGVLLEFCHYINRKLDDKEECAAFMLAFEKYEEGEE